MTEFEIETTEVPIKNDLYQEKLKALVEALLSIDETRETQRESQGSKKEAS